MVSFFLRASGIVIATTLFGLMPTSSVAAEPGASPGRIFLSFDDGPIDASLDVLDVLKANDVKATFFVNGCNWTGEGIVERAQHPGTALRRMIEEGHAVGNHSYDHMLHNAGARAIASSTDSYQDVLVDAQSFIPKNAEVINRALGPLKDSPNNEMVSLGRMPYSNNWVLPGLTVICQCCTSDGVAPWDPQNKCGTAELHISNSARLAGDIAKKLYQENGMWFFGWDVEWQPSNWSAKNPSETLVSAEAIEQDILDIVNGKQCTLKRLSSQASCDSRTVKGKVVLLTHEFLFDNSWGGRGKDTNLPQLDRLIKSLKEKGYVFETLNHYLD